MQTRLFEFKQNIDSDKHNLGRIALVGPGRYTGFDTIGYIGSGSVFTLGHGATGARYTLPNGNQSQPTGTLVTPQGVLIAEDSAITNLTLITNAGNSFERNDLIVCNHTYSQVTVGGNAATYSVIQGPLGNPALPSLPNPNTQTVLGVITLAPNATAAQALTDILTPPAFPTVPNGKYKCYNPNGPGWQRTVKVDYITKLAAMLVGAEATAPGFESVGGSGNVKMTFMEDSNSVVVPNSGGTTYAVNHIKKPSQGNYGTRVVLQLANPSSDDMVLCNNVGSAPTGFAPIIMEPRWINISDMAGVAPGLYLGAGDLVVLEYSLNAWYVVGVCIRSSIALAQDAASKNPYIVTRNTLNAPALGALAVGASIINTSSQIYSIQSGEINIAKAGTYEIEYSILAEAGAARYMLLSSDSSNFPDLDWQNTVFTQITTHDASHPDAASLKVQANFKAVITAGNNTKLRAYYSRKNSAGTNQATSGNIYLTIKVTKL